MGRAGFPYTTYPDGPESADVSESVQVRVCESSLLVDSFYQGQDVVPDNAYLMMGTRKVNHGWSTFITRPGANSNPNSRRYLSGHSHARTMLATGARIWSYLKGMGRTW